MPFRSIVGHARIVDLLARAVARDSLPPSLILAGPEGVGKHRVAIALAQTLNCLNPRTSGVPPSPESFGGASRSPGSDVDACGECAACRRIARGTFPDVIEVSVEDDAAIIKVEQIRAVLDLVGFRPYEGRRRIVIIDPADAMDRYGQNALLKVLEETPPATVFALVTSRPDALYATIRSRCPQIRFGALSVAEITQVLVRERGLPERDARAAAVVASGSASRAIQAASEESTDARSQALELLEQAASARDPRRLLEGIKGVFGMEKRPGPAPAVEREQVTLSLRALASLLRDVTLIGAGAGAELANADLRDALQRVAKSFGRARLLRAFGAVDGALDALDRNANPKVVVDWLAFQVASSE